MQSRWLGRCPDCGSWDTLKEEKITRSASGPWNLPVEETQPAVPIHEVEPSAEQRLLSGIGELDRVLGGGLVPGSSLLIAGEPGVGKSTLLLQAAQMISSRGLRFLYVSGEESAAQVKLRAQRIGLSGDELYLLAECEVQKIEEQILRLAPAAVGIDSIQALRWHELPSAAGSVIQVREVAARLLALARARGFPLLMVGHVTKDGALAGPRLLEHMVDAALSFEGERTHGLRILRGLKNRFGSTQEVGLFEMRSGGLQEVPDPSRLLLGDQCSTAPGSATAAILEGSRPLLVEIQALVCPTIYGAPTRRVSGLDAGRLSMLAAVLEKRLGIPLGDRDLYANAVGGVRITSTAADLALVAALLSSIQDRTIPSQRIYTGEVGLLGEVRSVVGIERRLEEAARLGFTCACIPAGASPEKIPEGISILEVQDLAALQESL